MQASTQHPRNAEDLQLRRIAIVGGGTAGWMAASVLARALPGLGIALTLVESPEIGTVGVGEATIPPIIELLRFLDINEADFVRHTQATYKLGIRFRDWSRGGASYWHPFGSFGRPINRRPFYHAWQQARADGIELRFNDYSANAALGDAFRFRFPDRAGAEPAAGLRYALHFDAGLVARYLRSYAERLGVVRLERTVAGVTRHADGRIDTLQFADGSSLGADLYLDCSGARAVLIGQALGTGYVDWSEYLPCDRAIAVPTALSGPRPPYTEACARPAGWRWRIPLQHRVGNGYVYASACIGDTQAAEDLLREVSGAPLAEPRVLRFTTGRRRRFWDGNCIALGLAAGFLEPLESTSIHLVMSGLYNLLDHFPDRRFCRASIDSYNAELAHEMERIRDFIVLHYCLSEREDTALWAHCRTLALPDSLRERIELYRSSGRIRRDGNELFSELSWFYIFDGMGVRPEQCDPLLRVIAPAQLRAILGGLAQSTAALVGTAPTHDSCFDAMLAPAAGSAP